MALSFNLDQDYESQNIDRPLPQLCESVSVSGRESESAVYPAQLTRRINWSLGRPRVETYSSWTTATPLALREAFDRQNPISPTCQQSGVPPASNDHVPINPTPFSLRIIVQPVGFAAHGYQDAAHRAAITYLRPAPLLQLMYNNRPARPTEHDHFKPCHVFVSALISENLEGRTRLERQPDVSHLGASEWIRLMARHRVAPSEDPYEREWQRTRITGPRMTRGFTWRVERERSSDEDRTDHGNDDDDDGSGDGGNNAWEDSVFFRFEGLGMRTGGTFRMRFMLVAENADYQLRERPNMTPVMHSVNSEMFRVLCEPPAS